MNIKTKLVVNMALYVVMALYLAYRELVMIHPDSIPFLNITMQL